LRGSPQHEKLQHITYDAIMLDHPASAKRSSASCFSPYFPPIHLHRATRQNITSPNDPPTAPAAAPGKLMLTHICKIHGTAWLGCEGHMSLSKLLLLLLLLLLVVLS
jgi:hypothetical protein